MVRNPSASAGWVGLIPGPGRPHVPQSNYAWGPEPAPSNTSSHRGEEPAHHMESGLHSPHLERSPRSSEDPTQPKINKQIYIYIYIYFFFKKNLSQKKKKWWNIWEKNSPLIPPPRESHRFFSGLPPSLSRLFPLSVWRPCLTLLVRHGFGEKAVSRCPSTKPRGCG